MWKRLILSLLLLFVIVLLWVLWIAATSYVRAPKLVSELDHAGVLGFSPSELPTSRLCALLVVQDPAFYRHHGIGLADGPVGHTTITQSIGKSLFFNNFNPGFLHHRKIQLMVAAWAFDRRVSKDMQLRLFLNRAYFGKVGVKEIIGFPDAASNFYGKSLLSLTDSEYFGLLAMLETPNTYHVVFHPKLNRERAARMRERVQIACANGCFQGDAPVPCATTKAGH